MESVATASQIAKALVQIFASVPRGKLAPSVAGARAGAETRFRSLDPTRRHLDNVAETPCRSVIVR
jgi:hypothetical protein